MNSIASLVLCIQVCLFQSAFGYYATYDKAGAESASAASTTTIASTTASSTAGAAGTAGYDAGLKAPGFAPYGTYIGPAAVASSVANAGAFIAPASDFKISPVADLWRAPAIGIGYRLDAAELGCVYGGIGRGKVAVVGELPVAGTTVVAGQLPILGAVDFRGSLPAIGSVTIIGSCPCGCNVPRELLY